MTAFVLIHSPLVGPSTWTEVADALHRDGHATTVPSLAGSRSPYWQEHVQRVVASSESLDDDQVVLVAHSGAGPLLPLVGDALGEPVSACIYVDAMLPTGGASRMEALPAAFAAELRTAARDGQLPPWGRDWSEAMWSGLIPDSVRRNVFRAELRPAPLAIYEEPIPQPRLAARVRSAYLQLSNAYDDEAAQAASAGWPVQHLRARHLHMLVEPKAVAAAITGLTSLITSPD